jgi:hypothetical protein
MGAPPGAGTVTERERSQAAVRRLAAPAAWVVAAFVFWLVHGGGTVGYDAFFELLWGDEVAQGVLPHYGPRSPTPHPLGIAVATVLAPLGDDDVLAARRLVSLLAFAGLGWAAFSLGRAAFSRTVGVVFAGIVLTRPPLLGAALNASIDVPFVALVLAAATLEVRRPRCPPVGGQGRTASLAAATLEIRRPRCSTRVLLVLAAAGLLRPEAWPLAGAYALAMASRAPWPQRARLAALAVIAPAVWTAFDLVVTGDPFYSLHATRTNAERSQDAGGPLEALAQAAASFRGILYPVVAVGALAGVGLASRYLRSRAIVPLTVLALSGLGYAAIALSGAPLLQRYVFLPVTMLALFCAVALLGWRLVPADRPGRRWWGYGAAVIAAALLVSAPWEASRVRGVIDRATDAGRSQSELRRLAAQPSVRAAVASCRPLQTRDFRARPLLLYTLRDRPPAQLISSKFLTLRDGLLLRDAGEQDPIAAPGFATVAGHGRWSLHARCPGYLPRGSPSGGSGP